MRPDQVSVVHEPTQLVVHRCATVRQAEQYIEVLEQINPDAVHRGDYGVNAPEEIEAPRFAVGTKYKTRGKHPQVCTVVDIHVTTNLAGDVVRVGYVTSHEFCGQTVLERDVCDTTIARGLSDHPSATNH